MKLFIFGLISLTALPVFAQEPDQVFIPPSWLIDIMMQVYAIPVVGAFVVEAGKWVGFLAAVLTGLSVFLMSIQKALQALNKLAVFGSAVSKVILFLDKVLPYVKYFSVLNVSKDEIKK